MPYTKEALQNMYSLSAEDVLSTLTACGLPHDANEYSDIDIESRFDVVRQFFNNGQAANYEQATTLYQQGLEDNSSTDNKNGGKKYRKKVAKTLDITELLITAREQGFKLTLTEALKIFSFCGLKEQNEYTPEEYDRFIEACNLITQGKTPDVLIEIEDITTASEEALTALVDKVTDKLVEKIPPGFVKQLYVQKAIAKLAEKSEQNDDFFIELEEGIMQRLEGKSPMTLLMEKHRMNLFPRTSIKSMELPSESESDTTTS